MGCRRGGGHGHLPIHVCVLPNYRVLAIIFPLFSLLVACSNVGARGRVQRMAVKDEVTQNRYMR